MKMIGRKEFIHWIHLKNRYSHMQSYSDNFCQINQWNNVGDIADAKNIWNFPPPSQREEFQPL